MQKVATEMAISNILHSEIWKYTTTDISVVSLFSYKGNYGFSNEGKWQVLKMSRKSRLRDIGNWKQHCAATNSSTATYYHSKCLFWWTLHIGAGFMQNW